MILENSRVPILIVAGGADEDVAARLESGDIAGHLSKPFNLEQVREAIDSAVGVMTAGARGVNAARVFSVPHLQKPRSSRAIQLNAI